MSNFFSAKRTRFFQEWEAIAKGYPEFSRYIRDPVLCLSLSRRCSQPTQTSSLLAIPFITDRTYAYFSKDSDRLIWMDRSLWMPVN